MTDLLPKMGTPLEILRHIRRSVRNDPKLGLVVCIHEGSATMAAIDRALAAAEDEVTPEPQR